jgi:hypothetical protein
MEYGIIMAYYTVPVTNQCFVHLSRIGIGAVTVLNDVGVPKMGIAGEKCAHCFANII